MKKIVIALLSVFALIAILALALQSPWGTEKAVSLLNEAVKNSGLTVEIGEIQGSLPHLVKLKEVRVTARGFSITFASLEARLSLLRLLKREIAFSLIKGDEVSWTESGEPIAIEKTGLPFLLNVKDFAFTNVRIPNRLLADFEGHLRIGKKNRYAFIDVTARTAEYPSASARLLLSIQRNGTAMARLNLAKEHLSLEATGQGHWSAFLAKEGKIQGRIKGSFEPLSLNFSGKYLRDQGYHIQMQTNHFKWTPFSGRLFTNLDVLEEGDALLVKATWRIPRLGLGTFTATEVRGSGEARYEQSAIQGSAALTGDYLANHWEAKSDFLWSKGSSWMFPAYQIATSALEIKGSLEVRPDMLLVGTTELTAAQIHPLAESLYGAGTGKALWYLVEQNGLPVQAAHLDGKGSLFYWNTLFAQEISFYSDLTEPFAKPKGTIYLDMEKAKWGTFVLDSASLETMSQGENWPFKLFIDGEWRHPLVLRLDGFWRYNNPDLLISLQNGTGSFFNHPLTLAAPASFEYSPTLFRLNDFALSFADGSVVASIQREGNNTDARIETKHLPLDFLSLNPLDVAIGGFFDFEGTLKERSNRLYGDFHATVAQMEVGKKDLLGGEGHLDGHFDQGRLDLTGRLTVRETPLFDLDLSLPVHLEVWPFKSQLLYNKSAKGHFALNGRIEDFLDFANLGTHRLEGECHSDLTLSNTLAYPILEGYIDFENGYYQNYSTGTELKNIRAEWFAEKDTLYLRHLTAQDAREKGSLTAKGQIRCLPSEKFPYRIETEFSRLSTKAFHLVSAEAGGKILLTGNLDKGLAKGEVHILETDITVPDRLPRQLPDLEVVYKHANKPPEPPQPAHRAPYPLFLDLSIDAPDGIFISGRGLNSEWKGNFHLGGTQTAIAAKGQIELIKGEFLFSGRRFKLTEGALFFSGIPNEMPFLNLAGSMDVKDITIVARLKGPLNNPQITLHSTPPLAMGTIMSYLLFGQDMSEINSFQALQLANSLSSLAGEGPDVLEATRRSLGVDRLQILTVPSPTEDGEDTIAVQVGKYVTEDVLVSFSQGAEDASTNISIAVELKGGLSFVLESQAAQEQGKFTLKWSRNY
jgi:hypothetical protein